MEFLSLLYTVLLVAICLQQALLLYRSGKPAPRQDDEALKEWVRQQLDAQSKLFAQKQAELAQPGGDSGSAGDESRPAGLEPGAEPVSQRLRCLKYQAYAVEKGNGTAFSLSRPLQKEPPQDQNSQGGGQPHPQSGAQGYAAVLRVQHQLGNQHIVQPQGAQGQEKPCHGGGVLDFSKAAGPQAAGGGHAYPQVQKSQENFSSDDPDGVGRRLPGAHGNHRSGRMGAGLQGPSE